MPFSISKSSDTISKRNDAGERNGSSDHEHHIDIWYAIAMQAVVSSLTSLPFNIWFIL